MHPTTLTQKQTALVVVDVQERFRGAIPDFALTASRVSMAVRGFQILDLPILVTEQYPEGLGRTAEEIRFVLPDDFEPFEKSGFSACSSAAFSARLTELGVRQVSLCGLETHICVTQTALELLDQGLQVHLLTDAVCSRFEHDKQAGLARMQAAGATSSSIEMALFEMMQDSRHEQFKEIQNLIK